MLKDSNWCSPTGDSVLMWLEDLGLDKTVFKEQTAESEDWVEAFLRGEQELTVAFARVIRKKVGATVDFWMKRDKQYWAKRVEITNARR